MTHSTSLLSRGLLYLLGLLFVPLSSFAQTLIRDINPGTASAQINQKIAYGSRVYMMGDDGVDGAELWISNGTFGGTYQAFDIYVGSSPSYPANFATIGDRVYFRADHPAYGFEIWFHDTLTNGTGLLIDADPGTDDGVYTSTSFNIVESNGQLYMPLNDGVFGRELWTSDGTSAGTVRLLDTYQGNIGTIPGAGDPQWITPFGAGVLFSSYNYDLTAGTGFGRELYRSNGTAGTTGMVMDIHPGAGSSNPDNILVVGSWAFFSATDGIEGDEPWRTNGTPGATAQILDINPGIASSSPANPVQVGSQIFFYADDGVHGRELWRTNGTVGGTVIVKDINPGSGDSEVTTLGDRTIAVSLNGLLFFAANDGTNGREVWVSDGTDAGTYMLKDINPGAASSFPAYMTVYDGIVYFYANDGSNGYELWATDGTASRTQMLADINPGSGSGSPNDFVRTGNLMLFTANNGTSGSELFGLDLTTVVLPTLPVELMHFDAHLTAAQAVHLNWQTASETQNHYFEVERTRPNGSFEAIARLGTTQEATSYEAIDPEPYPGNTFYRLKQVDLDGTVHYSHMVNVHMEAKGFAVVATPNPATDHITLQFEGEAMPTQVELLDMQGRELTAFRSLQGQQTLDISLKDYPTGVYTLLLIGTNRRQHIRIRKL